jgi:catechol 2,3-dioxygenase-like lactoylglutathione lyase family enzyme
MPFHHVAYACRDTEATRHFYEDLFGFRLRHTEVAGFPNGGSMRHLFFDIGDGSSLAFFHVEHVGERDDWRSDISTGNGLPVWVNHVAFTATAERQAEVRARMDATGVAPLMEVDHGWCHSLYYLDPNGIMVELCRDTPGLPDDRDAAAPLLTWRPDATVEP